MTCMVELDMTYEHAWLSDKFYIEKIRTFSD